MILSKIQGKTFIKEGIPIYKHFAERIKEELEEDNQFENFFLWEETSPESVKLLFECLI